MPCVPPNVHYRRVALPLACALTGTATNHDSDPDSNCQPVASSGWCHAAGPSHGENYQDFRSGSLRLSTQWQRG